MNFEGKITKPQNVLTLKDCERRLILNAFPSNTTVNSIKESVPRCNRTVNNLKNGLISQEQHFSLIENFKPSWASDDVSI